MKTLVLVRHAKSSWDDPALDDHDRPLNERGRRDAPVMAQRLHERGIEPDAIVSSTAVRALSTAAAFAEAFGLGADDVVAIARLYGASPATIVSVVGGLDDRIECVIIVAHDPGLSELAGRLSAEIDRMPTGAVAVFRFGIESWKDLPGSRPVTAAFDTPRSGPSGP
jgi:phosphohistidine phosphatase